ncbi:hypothetical protein MKW98_020377, partial [Papaver atlanticum]
EHQVLLIPRRPPENQAHNGICSYFLLDERYKKVALSIAQGYQVLSNRNIKSRGHQKAKHIMGRKSFHGRKAEMVNVKERIHSFISSGITCTSAKCP